MTNCSCGLSPGHKTLQIFSTLTGILQISLRVRKLLSWCLGLPRGLWQTPTNTFSPAGRRFTGLATSPSCGNLVSCGFEWGISGSCTGLKSEPPCANNIAGTGACTDLTVWAALGQLQHSWEKFSVAFHTMDPNSAEHWAHAAVTVPVP